MSRKLVVRVFNAAMGYGDALAMQARPLRLLFSRGWPTRERELVRCLLDSIRGGGERRATDTHPALPASSVVPQESLAVARRSSAVPDTLLVLQVREPRRWVFLPTFTPSFLIKKDDAPSSSSQAPRSHPPSYLSQHKSVYTVGKRPQQHNILADSAKLAELGVEVHRTRRGGDVTYHGPGQFILYPIVGLRTLGLGARAYVEGKAHVTRRLSFITLDIQPFSQLPSSIPSFPDLFASSCGILATGLEDVMVATARSFGVEARGRLPDMTGVWVGERKLGAIGVQISGGVSMHGLAFNHDPDLTLFDHIVPCGLAERAVTSLALECKERHSKSRGEEMKSGNRGLEPSKSELEARLIESFVSQFGYDDVYLERKA